MVDFQKTVHEIYESLGVKSGNPSSAELSAAELNAESVSMLVLFEILKTLLVLSGQRDRQRDPSNAMMDTVRNRKDPA